MSKGRSRYDTDFKLKVVLESLQRDTTIEKVRIKYSISPSAINKWRKEFRNNAHVAFEAQSKSKTKPSEKDSPEYLKRVIGDITVENSILKKALSVWD